MYRGDDAQDGGAIEAPTADGPLRVEVGPRRISLRVADRALHVADPFATLIEGKRQESLKLDGRLVVARDVPREDLGIWIELLDKQPGMRRIFGVAPISLLEPDGLAALQRLDRVARRVRAALADHARSSFSTSRAVAAAPPARDVGRAVEIGRGLDKVLLADLGDHHVVYARRLFRDRAHVALVIHGDGRVVIHDGKLRHELAVTSKFGILVSGDYLRFTDRHG